MSDESEYRPAEITIALTRAAPIVIVEDDWPIIAQAHDVSVSAEYHVFVREHDDGRRIVYGRSTHGAAGELISHSNIMGQKDRGYTKGRTPYAIIEVCVVIGYGPLAQKCIADLPARMLT